MSNTENTAKNAAATAANNPAEKSATELKLTETKNEAAEAKAPQTTQFNELATLIEMLSQKMNSELLSETVDSLYNYYKMYETEQAKDAATAGLKAAQASELLAKLVQEEAITIEQPDIVMLRISEL